MSNSESFATDKQTEPAIVLLDFPRFSAEPLGMQLFFENLLKALDATNDGSWRFIVQSTGLRGEKTHHRRVETLKLSSKVSLRWIAVPDTALATLNKMGIRTPGFLYAKAAIVHSFGGSWVPGNVGNLIATVQDIIPLIVEKEHHSQSQLEQIDRRIRSLLSRAQVITTISEFSRKEISAYFAIDPAKIEVIPDGVDHDRFKPLEAKAPAPQSFAEMGIRQKYILSSGGQIPRKNLPRLIAAFDQFKIKTGCEHQLVMTGFRHPTGELLNAMEAAKHKSDIVVPGYLPDHYLPMLYRHADMMAFPSLYEGFGLPPLEAMASGTPVALSKASSLPEVGGDAAVYFDPLSTDEICTALEKLALDQDLRTHCIQAGLKQAARFSWKHTALSFQNIYRSLLSSN